MCCIAERVVRDVARRARRQRSLRVHLIGSGAAGRQANDSFAARLNEASANVQEILAVLETKDRSVLDLIGQGFSPAQVAAATGVSITAHQSRWRRLVARLRALASGVTKRQKDAVFQDLPPPPGQWVRRSRASIDAVRALIGYRLITDFEQGLRLTLPGYAA